MPGAAKSRPSTTRKIIVDFPDALYLETQKAVQELSMKRSAFIRDPSVNTCIVWRGAN